MTRFIQFAAVLIITGSGAWNSAADTVPPYGSAVKTTNAAITTHTFTAGLMQLGISANGGGFVNHVYVNGGTNDLMRTEAPYGRGWQGSVRDSLHGGRYNPTQAGFSDKAGVPVSLTNENGRLWINRFNLPLFSDAVFDFTANEELGADYAGYNDGLNMNTKPVGDPYIGDTDGYTEPAGWMQDDEVRSEFDFEGFYEDAGALAGGQASVVRFFQRYSYVRDPKAIYQFGTNAILMSGLPVYNPDSIAQSGDISSSLPGEQLATAVDLAGIIFTSYGIRLTADTGYTNQMWYSGGQWYSAPGIVTNGDDRYKIPGSGISPIPSQPVALDYGFIMVANGTNPAAAYGFGLYVPMTEVNRKCTVGIKKADGTVAYRENRLTDCVLLVSSGHTNQVSIRARYFLKGMLAPANGTPGVYEALESDQYVLYGTPNEILSAVRILESNLFAAGTGTVRGTPQNWLDAYGITNETSDADGDGLAAWQEYRTGTDPADTRSTLAFTSAVADFGGGKFIVRWQAVNGKNYKVLSTTNLVSGAWDANALAIPGIAPECAYTALVQNAESFFKVQVQ